METNIEKKHKDIHYQMKQRCYNSNHKKYKNYGERGIVMTESWLGENGYRNFIQDMGYRPDNTYSIDRINVDGIYEKDNCRWATTKEQSLNRTVSSKVSPGDIIGKLTVIREVDPIPRGNNRFRRMFECVCECGNHVTCRMDKLNDGRIKSCGEKPCNKFSNGL